MTSMSRREAARRFDREVQKWVKSMQRTDSQKVQDQILSELRQEHEEDMRILLSGPIVPKELSDWVCDFMDRRKAERESGNGV